MRRCLFFIVAAMFLFSTGAYAQAMSPLKSYWCNDRIDYFGTTTDAGQKAALEAFGCKFSRLEVMSFPASSQVPWPWTYTGAKSGRTTQP